MKITELHIEGFRSLKNVTWKPGDLNVIIGPNGSGKSNLLRALEMISAAAQGKLEAFIYTSGGINQVLWDGQADIIKFSVSTSATGIGNAFAGFTYHVDIEGIPLINDYSIDREILEDAGDKFRLIDKEGSDGKIRDRKKGREADISAFDKETVLASTHQPLVDWISASGLPFYCQQMMKWTIHHDIRTDTTAVVRLPAVTRFERSINATGENLINVLHTLYTSDRDFKQMVNAAMRAAFGDDFEELIFPPAADQRIQLRVRWKTLKREQSAADLSDGTLRFLFLVTVLASPSPPPLIAIDEPETGLHPSMLPIIAELAADAALRTQVIFTTHSDQFLDAFRDTRPTTTVAKWKNGETTLTTLDGEELDYWLKDYTLGNLFRTGALENMA